MADFRGTVAEAITDIGLVQITTNRLELPAANLPGGAAAAAKTIFVAAGPGTDVAAFNEYLAALDDSTSTNAISMRNGAAGAAEVTGLPRSAGGTQPSLNAGPGSAGAPFRAAFACAAADFELFVDGVSAAAETFGSMPAVDPTAFHVRGNPLNASPWADTMFYAAYVPRRVALSDFAVSG